MTALWDTGGVEVLRELAAARRREGVTSGLVLTLVAVVDERPGVRNTPVKAVEDAATVATSTHPCRLLVVTRSPAHTAPDRLDAEIVVGGRLGPCEAVIMRVQGRLALHAESVVMPLLAPDVPVVTWWHGPPPERISSDPLGVVAERRITDCALADDPVAALRRRAVDYAAGDTDLAWTRLTGWRTLIAGTLDLSRPPPPRAAPTPAQEPRDRTTVEGVAPVVVGATLAAPAEDASAALLSGWLAARLQVTPTREDARSGRLESVRLALAGGDEVSVTRHEHASTAGLRRTGQDDRTMPLLDRTLGDLVAEELRRLDPDETYAAALSATTGLTGLSDRPATRVHTWVDPALEPAGAPAGTGS